MTEKLTDTEMTKANNPQHRARRSGGFPTEMLLRVREGEPESSTSALKSKGKGKSKEEDYNDVTGIPKNIEDEIAVIDRQIDALNERKSELQGTELLDKLEELHEKLEELHKKIHGLAIAVPEKIISTRKQALGSSGVHSAGERSEAQTGNRLLTEDQEAEKRGP